MYCFHHEYPSGPPGTSKGKVIISYGGKEIICENAELVMTAKLFAGTKVTVPEAADPSVSANTNGTRGPTG